MEKTIRLLAAAGVLMLLAGALFALIRQWVYAALIWAGALGCLAAALPGAFLFLSAAALPDLRKRRSRKR